MKSLLQMAAEVEQQREAVRAMDAPDDDIDSSEGGTIAYRFSRSYQGELADTDDLVISVSDGLAPEDSPFPLTDLYRFFQGVLSQARPGEDMRGTIKVSASFVPQDPDAARDA